MRKDKNLKSRNLKIDGVRAVYPQITQIFADDLLLGVT